MRTHLEYLVRRQHEAGLALASTSPFPSDISSSAGRWAPPHSVRRAIAHRRRSQARQPAQPALHEEDPVHSYVYPGERVIGYGHGGSESLTLFLESEAGRPFVRKVLSEKLVTARWDPDGTGVMLPPHRKAQRQTDYLRSLPGPAKPLFPCVLASCSRDAVVQSDGARRVYREFIYDMTYVRGVEVSRFIAAHQPSPSVVARLYAAILSALRERVHSQRRRVPARPTLEASYFSKIESRLALCRETAPLTFNRDLLDARFIVVNGRRLLNAPELLKVLRERPDYRDILEPPFHSLVAGDTNTENIKIGNPEPLLRATGTFSWQDLDLHFIDPRAIGFHENGVDTGADDPMYDNKPWHNSLGRYDCIHGDHFELELGDSGGVPAIHVREADSSPYRRSYAGIHRYFKPIMTRAWSLDDPEGEVRRLDPNWLVRFAFVMGTHFMAMPPFHIDRREPADDVKGAAGIQKRPLAIYAEGLRWLNLAVAMLEGRVRSFLGFAVPRLGRGA